MSHGFDHICGNKREGFNKTQMITGDILTYIAKYMCVCVYVCVRASVCASMRASVRACARYNSTHMMAKCALLTTFPLCPINQPPVMCGSV